VNLIEYIRHAFVGTSRARDEHHRARATQPTIEDGLATFATLEGNRLVAPEDKPIFLLSAGWRSGSTLLQRLIMSSPQVLLWGEPYDECGVIQALAQTMRCFRPGWPPSDYFLEQHAGKPLAGEWIANLFPEPQAWRAAHLAFFERAFAEPARHAGATRWGIKEVRLDVQHAHYLRWIYPDAKFVFLYRDPLQAYRSYCRYGRNWYDTWPDRPVFTPTAFGRHWRNLTQGYLRGANKLGALVLRYEDVVQGSEALLSAIDRHLEISVDRSVLSQKIGSSERGGEQAWVSRLEKSLLRRAVSPVAQELGYRW